MIFVTVGTHEQGMIRLLKELDNLIDKGSIVDEVVVQSGYTEYKSYNFIQKEMIAYDEMDYYIRKADIIITHGGPGSIFHPLQYNKIPIVVPRNPSYNEHVDDHQILFTKRLEDNNKVIPVYDIGDLEKCIKNYNKLANMCKYDKNSNERFIKEFSNLINELMN